MPAASGVMMRDPQRSPRPRNAAVLDPCDLGQLSQEMSRHVHLGTQLLDRLFMKRRQVRRRQPPEKILGLGIQWHDRAAP